MNMTEGTNDSSIEMQAELSTTNLGDETVDGGINIDPHQRKVSTNRSF